MADPTLKDIEEEVKKSASDLQAMLAKKEKGEAVDETKLQQAANDYLAQVQKHKPRKSEPEIEVSGQETLEEIHKAEGYSSDSRVDAIAKRAEFQKATDDVFFMNSIMKGLYAVRHGMHYDIRKRAAEKPSVRAMLRKMQTLAKALYSTGSTVGDEFVPTESSGQYFDYLKMATPVASLFRTIPMPSNPYTLPLLTGGFTVYLTGESTTDTAAKHTASTPATSSLTMTAKKFAARGLWSAELDEDSIIPMMGLMQEEMRYAHAKHIEGAIINGDTAGTHQDSNVTASNDYRKAFLGLRAWAVDESNATAATATIVAADFRGIRQSMGKYGIAPTEVVWVTSPMGWNVMSKTFTQIQTLEQYGPGAFILTGEIAKIDGIPVVVSGEVPENLNASGVYDGSTVDNTVALLVRRDAFLLGSIRELKIETQRDIETDQSIIVGTVRKAGLMRWPTGTDPIWQLHDVD